MDRSDSPMLWQEISAEFPSLQWPTCPPTWSDLRKITLDLRFWRLVFAAGREFSSPSSLTPKVSWLLIFYVRSQQSMPGTTPTLFCPRFSATGLKLQEPVCCSITTMSHLNLHKYCALPGRARSLAASTPTILPRLRSLRLLVIFKSQKSNFWKAVFKDSGLSESGSFRTAEHTYFGVCWMLPELDDADAAVHR